MTSMRETTMIEFRLGTTPPPPGTTPLPPGTMTDTMIQGIVTMTWGRDTLRKGCYCSCAWNWVNHFRYGDRYGPSSRAYYDRPPASRRDYHDPREYERWRPSIPLGLYARSRYERYPLHQSSDYSSRRRSRSPLPPIRRDYWGYHPYITFF